MGTPKESKAFIEKVQALRYWNRGKISGGNVNFVIIIDRSRFGSVTFFLFFIEIGVLIFDAVEGQRCEDPLNCCLYESSSL